jgi:hypothetical protein
MKKFTEIREARRSAQDRLSARAAKHGLGSQKRLDKIKKSSDFFSKPPPSFSKAELKKMGYAVEGRFDIEIPAPKGMKGRKNPTRTALNKKLSAKHADKIAKNAKRDQARSARAGGALTRKGHNDNSYKKGVTGKFFSTQPAFESSSKVVKEASATNVNKIRTAYKDFMKKKGKNFDDIAMSLTMIANRMTQLSSPDGSGRGDYKAEKIIKDEASRIQGIVNKTYDTEEGKEIRNLLKRHGLYSSSGSANSAIMKLIWNK